jgi:signal transduction histidine kinase/ActR/RegA family two-component response regulator
VVSYAFVLPVVHLAGRVLGLLDPVLDGSRETLVLACALLLGGQAVLHQYLLNDRFRRLSGDLYEARILLQQSRKMEALGRLAGGVAHGFNNLLSVILGYTEMLAERFTPGDQASESLQQVKLAAEKASALTRQLAIFSLGRLGRDVPLELDAVVAGHLPIVRRLLTGSVTLTFRPGAPGAWIRADADQFERALLNIAANARDAIEGAGEVRITTRTLALAEGDASIGLLPPGPYVEIAISDTGAGMSDPVRSRLFEPFFTTRQDEGHRGLGLAIVYGVVRQASGHIEVHSAPGAGTTIRMYLPRCLPAQTAAEEAEDRGAHVGGRPFTVLLAEDEAGLRRLIRSTLEAEGFRVIEAADGQAAVDCAEQHPGAIDLFLSDVVMPGCAGPEAARRIVEERPETRVLFISGYAPEVLGDLRVRGAAVALVAKPFVLTDLLSQVRALLAGEIRSGSGPDERGSNESEVRT